MEINVKKILFILLFTLCNANSLLAQQPKYDAIWCLGDSAGIDFNDPLNPHPIQTGNGTWTSASLASIADSTGNLLFYAAGVTFSPYGVKIYNRNHQVMQNGDSVFGHPWNNEGLIIIPKNENQYYLFSLGRSPINPFSELKYSVIDLSFNAGLGRVIQKNIFVMYDTLTNKMSATKSNNSMNWWLMLQGAYPTRYIKISISSAGIGTISKQIIGTNYSIGYGFNGESEFDKSGNQFAAVNSLGIIDVMDFDRCTGELSNLRSIGENFYSGATNYFGCEFSPDGSKLYVTNIDTNPKIIYQYDLVSADITASKTIIHHYADTGQMSYIYYADLLTTPNNEIAVLKRGLNPFDTINNGINNCNTNLDLIHFPNSNAATCGYEQNAISLGGRLVSGGLPNMPNYALKQIAFFDADAGTNKKICSGETTQLGVPEVANAKYEWSVSTTLSATDVPQPFATPNKTTTYYLTIIDSKNSCNEKNDTVLVEVADGICVTVQTLLSPHDHFQVYDLLPNTSLKLYNAIGQLIYVSSNYQNDFDVTLLAAGMHFYVLKFAYSDEWMTGKFVVMK